MTQNKRKIRLTDEGRRALNAAVTACNLEDAANERATDRLHEAVKAGVPIAQLSEATGIPRMTLLRRLGKVSR